MRLATGWRRTVAIAGALFVGTSMTSRVSAESTPKAPAAVAGLAIHHVQISVADADALAAWYVRTLGFRIAKRATAPGVKIVWIDITGFRLGLAQVDGSARPAGANITPPADVMTQGYRQIHFSVPEVDAAYGALVEIGVHFAIPPTSFALTGIRLATFADPEGNVISLYQDLDAGNEVGSRSSVPNR